MSPFIAASFDGSNGFSIRGGGWEPSAALRLTGEGLGDCRLRAERLAAVMAAGCGFGQPFGGPEFTFSAGGWLCARRLAEVAALLATCAPPAFELLDAASGRLAVEVEDIEDAKVFERFIGCCDGCSIDRSREVSDAANGVE